MWGLAAQRGSLEEWCSLPSWPRTVIRDCSVTFLLDRGQVPCTVQTEVKSLALCLPPPSVGSVRLWFGLLGYCSSVVHIAPVSLPVWLEGDRETPSPAACWQIEGTLSPHFACAASRDVGVEL